jgi:type IV pilus assembly protein PilV
VALRTRQESALMSRGVQLATSFADRMRANTAQMRLPDSVNPYLLVRYEAARDLMPGAPAIRCHAGASCDSAAMASFDVYELQYELYAAFPSARVAVCRDAVMWDPVANRLSWECTGGSSDPVVLKLGWLARPSRGEPGESAPVVAVVVTGGST